MGSATDRWWTVRMTTRYLWTLDQADHDLRSGLATVSELTAILAVENLPGVAPPEWIVTALLMDEDDAGAASYVSPLGWTLAVQRMQAAQTIPSVVELVDGGIVLDLAQPLEGSVPQLAVVGPGSVFDLRD